MRLSPEQASHILLRCPSDIGIRNTDRKGTLNAPEQLLRDHEYDDIFIDEIFPHEFSLPDNQDRIRTRTTELLQYDRAIISIGGDHSISYPLIDAFSEKHEDLHLIWIDAHYDLKEIRVDDGIPHDAVIRGLINDNSLTLEDILFCGIRESDPDEDDFLLNKDWYKTSVTDIEDSTITDLRETIDTTISPGDDPVYVSFDIDVLDADLVPGTTFPSEDGLSLEAAQKLINAVKAYNTVGWDIVEVAPPLDRDEKTLQAARTILETILE